MKITSSIIRNSIILGICLLVVVATQAARTFVKADDAENQQVNPYLEMLADDDDIQVVISEYHDNVNELFNDKIEEMMKLGASKKPEDLDKMLKFVVPPPIKTDASGSIGREGCDGEAGHLSTYCLSISALNEYFKFREAMIRARGDLKYKIDDKIAAITPANESGSQQKADISISAGAVMSYGNEVATIDREIDVSKEALDQALAAYNEIQMALPLHQKYKQVISALEKYRDKISDVRQEVDLYPVTFLDVTTTSCN
ncbi:MAG: hypothetical protein AAB606_03700 [Patescibacteria group bacterium]